MKKKNERERDDKSLNTHPTSRKKDCNEIKCFSDNKTTMSFSSFCAKRN